MEPVNRTVFNSYRDLGIELPMAGAIKTETGESFIPSDAFLAAVNRARVFLGSSIIIHEGHKDLILAESEMLKGAETRVMGTFAARDFKKGETIRFFEGDLYSRAEIHELIDSGKLNNDDPLQIGRDSYIVCNEDSRQINHSCDPNAGIRGERELIALRDIKTGEEVTFDYSITAHPDITPEIWTMPCNCGCEACRGNVQNISTIPLDRLATYLAADAVPGYLIPVVTELLASNKPA